MTTKRIKLEVPKTDNEYPPERIKGYAMFPEIYSNIYISAKKKSGKTTVIYNILKKCVGKETKVLIFCPTVTKDAMYKEIIKMLNIKQVEHSEFDHFIDDDGNDLIADFIREAKERNDNEEEPEIPTTSRKYVSKEEARLLFGDELPKAKIEQKIREDIKQQEEEKKKREAKKRKKGKGKIAPEFILVFDDLGQDLRKKSISQLLIKNRHYKCKVIISSQWITYLSPVGIRQLDYCLLFSGFPDEKITDLHQKLDIGLDVNKFIQIYKQATEKKYHFLYIDINEKIFKKDFNEILE